MAKPSTRATAQPEIQPNSRDNWLPISASPRPDIDPGFSSCPETGLATITINQMPTIYETEVEGSNVGEKLVGSDRSNVIYGKGGNDVLFGLGSSDAINGGNGNDRIFGGEDSDRLFGSGGKDTLIGELGNDLLDGGAGNDRLQGGAGDDILIGGGGRNRLIGGGGADGFVLSRGFEPDIITDFQDGIDLLGLPDGVCFSKLVIEQQGTDTLVSYRRGSLKIADDPIALLKGVQASSIAIADFANVQSVF